MLARHRQLFATAVFFLDAMIIAVAWVAAYALRFYGLGLAAPLGVPPLSTYLWFDAVLTPFALLVLRTFRIYRSARTARLGQELYALVQGMAIVTAIVALASFFARGELSRSVLVLFAVVATGTMAAGRVAIRIVLRQMRRAGRNLRHVVVVGTGPLARELVGKFLDHPDFGIVPHGYVTSRREEVGQRLDGVEVVGTVDELPALVERERADVVYLALGRSEWQTEDDALRRLSDSTAAVRLVPDLARAFTLNASVEDLDGMPVVLVTESPDQGWNAVAKRTFDLVFSALGLMVLTPVLAAVALWVRLDSAGPVLYAQERVGLNGRRFRMLKFRTMRVDADAGGVPEWSRPDDPRRTRAGAVLRTLSLDELPQLWNVFLGQMSLVGPRPEQPYYVQRFRETVPRYMLRHHVKAGITGWAQIHGLRGDTPLDRRIEYDLYYIRNWSLAFDVKILLLTVLRVFRDATAH